MNSTAFEAVKACYGKIINTHNNHFEAILEGVYSSWLKNGDHCIDIGAHVGRHTAPMANAVGSQGCVHAFEPLPKLFARLEALFCDGAVKNIVRLYPLALSDRAGRAEFLHVEDAAGLSGLKERTSHEGHAIERIQVDVAVLDDLIPDDEIINFIKIDAEGADFHILKGASRILDRCRPLVVFESGRINAFPAKSYGYSEDEFNRFFDSHHYVLYDIAGFKYNPDFWSHPTLNDFVAIPKEREEELRELLLAAVLTEFVTEDIS